MESYRLYSGNIYTGLYIVWTTLEGRVCPKSAFMSACPQTQVSSVSSRPIVHVCMQSFTVSLNCQNVRFTNPVCVDFVLIRLPLETILAADIFKLYFLKENDKIMIKIWLQYIPGVQLAVFQHWFV